MNPTLSNKELEIAKHWLYSLFVVGGLTTVRNPNLQLSWTLPQNDCKIICDEIKYRNFDFVRLKLDTVLSNIADHKFYYGNGRRTITRPAEKLADYIGWFCSDNNILWDDSLASTQELDEYKKTIFAGTLIKWGCFVSLPATQQSTQAGNATTSTATRAASTRQPGQAPVNGYKGTGSHSGDIPNLIGQAGAKIIKVCTMYCIEADPIGKNTPYAFITPLRVASNGSIIKINKTQAEAVHFSSGNGFTDCALWFSDIADAQNALSYCQTKFGAKYNNIHIGAKPAAGNGYFYVSTELGNAYIKANKLNEELEEAIAYNRTTYQEIPDIDLFEYWMHHSDN